MVREYHTLVSTKMTGLPNMLTRKCYWPEGTVPKSVFLAFKFEQRGKCCPFSSTTRSKFGKYVFGE